MWQLQPAQLQDECFAGECGIELQLAMAGASTACCPLEAVGKLEDRTATSICGYLIRLGSCTQKGIRIELCEGARSLSVLYAQYHTILDVRLGG